MSRPRRSTTNYAAASDKAPAAKKSANPSKKSSVKAESKNTEKKDGPLKGRRLSAEVLEERADKAAIHWEDCFKDLVKFHKQHKHCLVPKIYPENQKLAYWVQRNRKHYKLFNAKQKSLLDAKRIKRLEKLGFIFVARGAEIQSEIERKKKREKGIAKWNRHFKELKQYKAKNGDCLVPKCFEENRALASWVYNQRFQFKKLNEGADVPLDEERIKKLNAIGFCWKAKTNEAWKESDRVRRREKSQDGWDEKFDALVDFKKKHGHTCVPKTYKPDQPLSSWVFRMRRQYGFRLAGKINNMSDDRLERLKKIGFQFRVRPLKGESKSDLKFKALAAGKSRPSRSTRSKNESVKEESSDEEEDKVEVEAEAEEEDEKSTSAGTRTRFPRNAKAIASALTKPPPSSMKPASKRKVKNETEEDDRKMPAKPDPFDDTKKAEGPRRATRDRAAKSSHVDSMESTVTIASNQTKRKAPRSLKRKSPASKPEQEPKKKSKVTSPRKVAPKKPEPMKPPEPMDVGSSPVVSTRTTRTSLAARASETKDSKEKMQNSPKPADVPPPKTRTSPRRSKENQKDSTEVIQEKPVTKSRRSPRVSLQNPALEPTKPTSKTSTSKVKVPSKQSADESTKKNSSMDKKEHVPNEVTSAETPKRTEPLRRSSRKKTVDAIEQIPPAAAEPTAGPAKRTRPIRQAAAKSAAIKADVSSKKKNTENKSAKKPATKPSKTTAAKKTSPEPKTKAKPEPKAVAKPEPKKKELVYESEEESDDEYDTTQQYMVSPREEKRKEKKQKKFVEKQKIYIFSDSESEGFSDDDSSVEGTTKRYYSGDEYERSDDEGMS